MSKIKLLAMDVDGTLTDGAMVFLDGEQLKMFSVYDGLGIRIAMNYGLRIAWVTGNVTPSVTQRAKTLGVEDVYQGARFKANAVREIAAKYGLELDEIAFIGDDLNDLPAFDSVGLPIAVANAAPEVKALAYFTTERSGGSGAVREAIERILKARGEWDAAVNSFLEELREEDAGKAGPEAVA